jgi:hypothetical protein
MALIAGGLFFWARRDSSRAGEARVLTPKEPTADATPQFDIDRSWPEQDQTPMSAADRVVLLKQAYTARGKKLREIGKK